MTKYLYGVTFKDPDTQSYLDLLKILADPMSTTRSPSHITLQGPYEEKKSSLENITCSIAKFVDVEVLNTAKGAAFVFIVEIEGIHEIWDKPHFPNGKPHITVFEGEAEFANKLYEVTKSLNRLFNAVEFETSDLEQINKKLNLTRDFPNYEDIKNTYKKIFSEYWPGIKKLQTLDADKRMGCLCEVLNNLFQSNRGMNDHLPDNSDFKLSAGGNNATHTA